MASVRLIVRAFRRNRSVRRAISRLLLQRLSVCGVLGVVATFPLQMLLPLQLCLCRLLSLLILTLQSPSLSGDGK